MSEPCEAWFGFVERPFSLTPDPKYFFRSRSHARALEALTFALRSTARQVLFATGDLGVGKTLLCRTLAGQLRRRALVSYAPTPLLSEAALLRLLLEDFGALSPDHLRGAQESDNLCGDLHARLVEFLRARAETQDAVLIVDEAQLMTRSFAETLEALLALEVGRPWTLHCLLAGQPLPGGFLPGTLKPLDGRIAMRVRVLPLAHDECGRYVAHRLALAGGHGTAAFSPRAIDALFAASGGVPRLVNLLCERALEEAARAGVHQVEADMVEQAASALHLVRARPRRFRWFQRRIS